jgi:hypothetical protein
VRHGPHLIFKNASAKNRATRENQKSAQYALFHRAMLSRARIPPTAKQACSGEDCGAGPFCFEGLESQLEVDLSF